MEVTSENFNDVLKQIEVNINDCLFISIDCELSGLQLKYEVNAFDTPQQYYEKILKNCRGFLIMQYGISLFRFDSTSNEFKQQTYNCYIFRKPNSSICIPDSYFTSQTSCLGFLANQNFDFNKLFKHGVSYMNISEETNCRKLLEEKKNIKKDDKQTLIISEENQPFIDQVISDIDNFLKDDELKEMELPKCNAFLRRLIYQTTDIKYKNKVFVKTVQKQNDRILLVSKIKDIDELDTLEKSLSEEKFTLLEDFIGFSKILKLIVNSGKLVVGHNMYLDIFHTVDKFLTPVPSDYQEYKDCVHSLFPQVLDTKYMATCEPFKDIVQSTVLKEMLDSLLKLPNKMPIIEIETNGYSLDDNKQHEAGYDAYITGLAFISMWSYLGKLDNLEPCNTFNNYDLLDGYKNRIFLMVLKDYQFFHLGGDDPNPNRDHVFYLTFPKEWKLGNILELFSPFGNVYVSWINETSAYVALNKKNQAAVALNTLSQSDIYTITTYKKHQTQLSGVTNTIRSPVTSNVKKKHKRTYEHNVKPIKKFKTNTGHSILKQFETIEEEDFEQIDDSKTTNKTFTESDWD